MPGLALFNAGLADTQLRAHVLDNALMVDSRFEPSEAMSAVERRASAAGVRLTELQCRDHCGGPWRGSAADRA